MKIKKLLIVLGCCVITLFSLVFVGCKRDTAKASIISSNYLVELPFVTTELINTDSSSLGNIVIPNMYLGEDNNGLFFYYLYSVDGLQPTFNKAYLNDSFYLHYGFTYVDELYYTTTNYNGLTNIVNGYSYCFCFPNNITINDIINNSVSLNVKTYADELIYEFFDSNGSQVCFFEFSNIKHTRNINETFTNFNVVVGQIDYNNNLQLYYNNGYQDGYTLGYSNGYNIGLTDGFGATTPFDIIVDSVNGFLDIELFGSFKISTMLYITFGMILMGIVIKVFLGG